MQPQPPPQPEPAHRRASPSTCSTATRRSIGCMAGLLRLISPYHRSHHRKRLTAKNNAAQASAPSQPPSPTKKKAPSPSPSPEPSPVKPAQQPRQQPPAVVRRRRSCDSPRSPTIAPEHRRSSCDSPRPPPPAIVARLMGLEESAPPSPAAAAAPRPVVPARPPPPPPPPETAAEKRRKLLGALEKCDEDLKTLRRIIAAVRAAEMRAAAGSDAAPAAGIFSRDEQSPSPSPYPSPPTPQQPKLRGVEQQHPSPDSVLDAISSPRFPCRKRPSPCTDLDAGGKAGGGNGAGPPAVGSKIVKPSRTLVFTGDHYRRIKSGDEDHYRRIKSGDELQQLRAVHSPVPLVAGMPRSASAESWRHHRRRWELEAAAAGRVISRAMVESAGEAMRGPQGGNEWWRRERAMVAAALERAIVQDLVGDLVSGLLAQSGRGHGHGHGAAGCRKRLCF
ncbi:serine/arginine repetitive matrix protein 1-like [Panicum virgatum]|uniref:Uncharacterized protein n=1 Tax=Panicum virgatum TaxID=38727 RepID=A0A8T0MWW7_PANVG|nr:serine/arginine repetitive matrix protein 1-like [Panicum virgatum]KAG2541208.1 hypothetical protein PVAP13_9NG667414 [Panicum virgatum]